MADFVAVIRKAVDGLANNTPDTRSKVYEKARSAVVRQLENMKPRPPEELLNRQISKLDAAIAEVEGDYAEALPALDDEEDDFLVDQDHGLSGSASDAPVADEPVAEEPADEEVPAYQAAAEAPSTYADPEPLSSAPEAFVEPEAVEPAYHQDPVYEAAPVIEPAYDPSDVSASEAQASDDAQSDDHAHASWVGSDTAEEPQWQSSYEEPEIETEPQADNHYAGQWTQSTAPQGDEAEQQDEQDSSFDRSYTSSHQYDQDVRVDISEPQFDRLPGDRQPIDDAADDIFGHIDREDRDDRSSDALTSGAFVAGGAALAASNAASARNDTDSFNRYFDDAISQAPASTPQSAALPRADADPFSAKTEDGTRNAWDDLEDLIGYDGRKGPDGRKIDAEDDIDGTLRGDTASVIPPNVYAKPKKNRTKGILLTALGAIILAGGAFALYDNRAALNDMVGGLTESAQTAPSATTAASTDAAPDSTATSTGIPLPGSNGSADNGETTGTKFTQRLLADGSEKDDGPAPVSAAQPSTAEGISQAEQNEAAPAVETPAATGAPVQTPAISTGSANTPPPAVAQSGEQMFLYEEVLGQSVPSAIAGTVAWSVVNEQDADGKPLPTVQGQLSVPDRGISALLTFKKNTDASLPASHIIEIVFSTGPGFEGGAIDSVQRVAMKTTEQDRGNALIAVPAKITDDFHMVALNDFPDALKTNMELLSTRDWIDIPLAYRNGRRALMTLQKGPAGKQAFDRAIREWQAATPAAQQ